MRKLILLLLVLLFAFSMAACDISALNKEDDSNKQTDNGNNVYVDSSTFATAYIKAQALGYKGTLEAFINVLSADDGANLNNGNNISTLLVDNNGDLIVVLNDGKTINCGGITAGNETPNPDGSGDNDNDNIGDGDNDNTGDGENDDNTPHSHNYGEWIRDTYNDNIPCNEWIYHRVCNGCSDVQFKNGGYENHTFTIVTVNPTCTEQGYDKKTCSVCGLEEVTNYKPTVNHTLTTVTILPTCTERGYDITSCSECEFEEITNYKPTVNHTYNEYFSYNVTAHWLNCKYCEAKTGNGAHVTNGTADCSVCNARVIPVNLNINDSVVSWDIFANATGYIVKIGNSTYETAVNSINLAALNLEKLEFLQVG